LHQKTLNIKTMEAIILQGNNPETMDLVKTIAQKLGITVKPYKTEPQKKFTATETEFYNKFTKAVKETNSINKSKTKGKTLKALLDEI